MPDRPPSFRSDGHDEPVPVSEIPPEKTPADASPADPDAAVAGSAPTQKDALGETQPAESALGETQPTKEAVNAERDARAATLAPFPIPSDSPPESPAETERAILADLRRLAKKDAPETEDPGTVAAREAGYEVMTVSKPPSLTRRFFTILRHTLGLVYGSAVAVARDREQFSWVKGLPLFLIKIAAFFVKPLVQRNLRSLPLEQQLRRRLELLGPTYIKLGQVLALREDILPPFITEELKNLLDRLPVMPFPEFLERVSKGLGRPVEEMFEWIDPTPLGSASIGQIHRARTVEKDDVILKVVKPHIYVILKRDSRLLGVAGSLLQVVFSRYQPKRILDEFAEYTLREVDLRREADNADQLSLNFADEPRIVFPAIYREYSSRLVLTMERFDGIRPDSKAAKSLPKDAREELVDLGAQAIIRMLYQDGFFHADLHPGNLFLLDTEPDDEGNVVPKIGFIDLGMVGFFDGELRRTLMYYYFSLVTGDAEGAARYLTSVASAGPKADPQGFKRAVAEICRRFYRANQYGDFSIAQLIMESVSLGGQYRMYFPIELVLMTKALVTFEGVGQTLLPGLDVATVSQRHVSRLFRNQFNPVSLIKEGLRNAPELVDLIVKSPTLAAEGMRFLEQRIRQPSENPLAGLRTALLAGAALVSGTIAVTVGGPWYLWGPLFIVAAALALKRS